MQLADRIMILRHGGFLVKCVAFTEPRVKRGVFFLYKKLGTICSEHVFLVAGIMRIKRLYPLKSTHSQLSFSTPCPAHVLQIFPLHCYAYYRIHRHRYPVSYVCLYVPATFLIPPAEHPPLCTVLRTYVSEHAVL